MEMMSGIVSVLEPTDVAQARRLAAEIAVSLGFDEVAAGRVAIVVTEAGTNLLKHASGGDLFVGVTGAGDARGVQVIAMDRGRGIANVAASVEDGFSTAGTAGSGLGAIRRTADSFDIYTGPDGTVLGATVYGNATSALPIGGITVPAPAEQDSGDAWAAWTAGDLTSVFVCDGLGHGAAAAAAARVAVDTFERHAERSASQIVGYVHDALRSTRGAAVALAELDQRRSVLRYCALGNISASIVNGNGSDHHLVSLAGIAGHMMRRIQEFTYEWPSGSLLVMHTDGIGAHWSLSRYAGLPERRPDVIAGVLCRDHRRGRDDSTVVVARNGAVA